MGCITCPSTGGETEYIGSRSLVSIDTAWTLLLQRRNSRPQLYIFEVYVRECPASVREDFVVCVVNQTRQRLQTSRDHLEIWRRRLAAAQVGECPRCVAQHRDFTGVVVQQPVATQHAKQCDVSVMPPMHSTGRLAHVIIRRANMDSVVRRAKIVRLKGCAGNTKKRQGRRVLLLGGGGDGDREQTARAGSTALTLSCALNVRAAPYRSSGGRMPRFRTMSRQSGPSPAMLPSAHTACSRTSSAGDSSSPMKMGMAPASMTVAVWSRCPEAMFVSAQAASNYRAHPSTRAHPHTMNASHMSLALSGYQRGCG